MKDNINLPPFYVGQRVVATRPSNNGYRVVDKIYTVMGLSKCGKCGRWVIDIGDTAPRYGPTFCGCKGFLCVETSFVQWHYADAFAPIESTFSAITLSEVIEIETPLICNN